MRCLGWGPGPTLGSWHHLLLPVAGLLLWDGMAAPSHGPRWALPGPDCGPRLPPLAESKCHTRPLSHGLHPSLPGLCQRCGQNTACGQAVRGVGGEPMILALLSQIFSINPSWPRGSSAAADVPSMPQGCSAP